MIGRARIFRDGTAWVEAFDPQSFVTRIYDKTPILAPAALAWRIYKAHRPVTPLEFSFRSSQHVVPDSLRYTLFAPGAHYPGFDCWVLHAICIPTWRYRLAGGLGGRLPLGQLPAGRYGLRVYAWDYAGNASSRETMLRLGARGAGVALGLPPQPAGRATAGPGD